MDLNFHYQVSCQPRPLRRGRNVLHFVSRDKVVLRPKTMTCYSTSILQVGYPMKEKDFADSVTIVDGRYESGIFEEHLEYVR